MPASSHGLGTASNPVVCVFDESTTKLMDCVVCNVMRRIGKEKVEVHVSVQTYSEKTQINIPFLRFCYYVVLTSGKKLLKSC